MADAEAALGVRLPDEYAAFMSRGGLQGGGAVLELSQALAYQSLRPDAPFPFTKEDAARILAARGRGEETALEPEDNFNHKLRMIE